MNSFFSGSEANVAVSLSILGENCSFVTAVPDNQIGIAAMRSLQKFGVDISKSIQTSGRLGLYYAEKGSSQRPSKVIYDRENSCFIKSHYEDYDWDSILNGTDWFHFSGITPALSEDCYKNCLEICKLCKQKNITVSCDLNYRSKLWTPEIARSKMPKLMNYVDVCIGNEEDADLMLGISPKSANIQTGKLSIDDYIDVCKRICTRYGCKYCCFTLRESYSASINGWSGILYDSLSKSCYNSKHYDILITDRMGAGDSFSAALIFSLLNNYDSQKVIDFSIAASCLKHTISDDFNTSTKEEIIDLMNNNGNGRIQR